MNLFSFFKPREADRTEAERLAADNGEILRAMDRLIWTTQTLYREATQASITRGIDHPAWLDHAGNEVVEALAILRRFQVRQ